MPGSVRNGPSVAAPWPLLLFQSSHSPGLRSPKHIQLNLDWLRLTTDTARPPEIWPHCLPSPLLSALLAVVFSLKSFCSLSLTPLPDPLPPHTQTPLCLPISPSTHQAQGQLTGADLRSVCSGLVLSAPEEIKCSSYSTGWIHVT